MFCSQCGTKNEYGSRFCENCGQPLLEDVEQPIQQASHEESFGYNDIGSADKTVSPSLTIPRPIYSSIYSQGATADGAVLAQSLPRNPINTKLIIISVVAAVVVIACIVLYHIAAVLASPQTFAVNTLRSAFNGDYTTFYNSLDITPGDFTGKAAFLEMMKGSAGKEKTGKLLSCNVTSVKDTVQNKKAVKAVTVAYTSSATSGTQKQTYYLIDSGKRWLFFNNYKLELDGMTANSYTVYVPKGGTLDFDNISVGEKYLSANSDASDGTQTYYDTYVLKNVFEGYNDIKITSPYTNDFSDTVEVTDGDTYIPSGIELSDSTTAVLGSTVQDDLNKIYTAAIAGDCFDDISSIFSSDSQVQSNLGNTYNQLVDDISYQLYSGCSLKNVTISNVQPDSSAFENSGAIQVSANFDCNYTMVETSSYSDYYYNDGTDNSGTTSEFTPSDPYQADVNIEFVYENGNWVISNFTDPSIYFSAS